MNREWLDRLDRGGNLAINVRYRVADKKIQRNIDRETDTYITDRDTFEPEVCSETDTYIICTRD